jgi:HSP20 family molecular chaperone IbpA
MSMSRPSPEEVRVTTAETARSMIPQSVPVNAYQTTGAFVIVALFPAVTENDVSVELTADGVRFWAELRSAGPREYAIHEWEYGGYERSIETPDGFGSGVEASLANGQLVVRVLSGEFTGNKTIQPTRSEQLPTGVREQPQNV